MMAWGVNSFVNALNRTGAAESTNKFTGLTCLCPIDEAFAANGHLDMKFGNLTEGPGSVLATINRHAIPGTYYSPGFKNGSVFYSSNGYPVLVNHMNGSVYLNDAKIIGTNFITKNGAMHVLDRVSFFVLSLTFP